MIYGLIVTEEVATATLTYKGIKEKNHELFFA
jgi:hypothetical protein